MTFSNLVEQTKKVKEAMRELQVQGESGAGMVKVQINGAYQVQDLFIDDEIYQAGKEVLKDLVVAAMNDGIRRIQDAIDEKMRKMMMNMGITKGG